MTKSVRRKWISRLAVAAVAISLLSVAIVLTPWSVGLCAEELVAESVSPQKETVAKAFIRNCGATTGFLTHVNLRSGWDYFNPTWVGTIRQGQVFALSCKKDVTLAWLDDSTLEIGYVRCSELEEADEKRRQPWLMESWWNGIRITYRERDANLNPEASPTAAGRPVLDYCELANNPERYDGDVVRVRARLWFSMHGYFFLDERCYGDNKQSGIMIPQDGDTWEKIESKIAKDLGVDEFTGWEFPVIVAVGKFRRVEPSKTSDAVYDNTHLIFEIMNVESAVRDMPD